jgi:acylphosphatase
VDSIRIRVTVDGRVQGVYFRESTRRMAAASGLNGWVRNLPDGRVEAAFEGDPAAVASAVEWMRSGPDRAIVTNFEEHPAEEPDGVLGFEVRY